MHDLGACLPMSSSLEFGFGQTTNGRSGLNFCAFDLGSLFARSIFLFVILRLGCVCDAVKLEIIMLKSGEGGGGREGVELLGDNTLFTDCWQLSVWAFCDLVKQN